MTLIFSDRVFSNATIKPNLIQKRSMFHPDIQIFFISFGIPSNELIIIKHFFIEMLMRDTIRFN